jgi:dTDP-4-dehydrorhamnose 3,5-epimerase
MSGKLLFEPLEIPGACRVSSRGHEDERGSFERLFCAREFGAAGIEAPFVQANLSRNTHAGTVRGLHYLAAPCREGKFIRCIEGEIYDVFVDLRHGSPTFGRWHGERLSGGEPKGIYIPPCCAHGYMTLTAQAAALYLVQDFYDQTRDRTLRWNDPAVGVRWPESDTVHLSPKDAAAPLLNDISHSELLDFSAA